MDGAELGDDVGFVDGAELGDDVGTDVVGIELIGDL
jgi:hypothetical protein